MVVKILSDAQGFNGVSYNTNKIEEGKGELLFLKNFPFSGTPDSSLVKDYLTTVSSLSRTKNPQFHAVISCKGREFTKEQLANFGEQWLKEMGYSKQPYLMVYHKDTENNHIHMVSTRVNLEGKLINTSFERLRSQKAIQKILDRHLGYTNKDSIKPLLEYKYQNESQLKTLLESRNYRLINKKGELFIYKNGIEIDKVLPKYNDPDEERKKVLKGIFKSYVKTYSTQLNNKGESEFTAKLKGVGVEIKFHQNKNHSKPFGYTIIDHKSKSLFKGSEVMKLSEIINKIDNQPIDSSNSSLQEENERLSNDFEHNESVDHNNLVKGLVSILGSTGGSGGETDQKKKRKKGRSR